MKRFLLFIFFYLFFGFNAIQAQTFAWNADTTTKYGTPGGEVVIHTYLVNNTASQVDLRVMRIVNQLPSTWSSSFCVGGLSGICYAPFIDTIPDPVTLMASEELELAIDFQTDALPASGVITVKIENMANIAENYTEILTVSTGPNGVEDNSREVTGGFQLYQNFPNPFNPSTNISFEVGLNAKDKTTLRIFNILGQQVRTLVNGNLPSGIYQVAWAGRDDLGNKVPSGIYFYQLRSGSQIKVKKMILLE
jgi:hypothetical protein